MREPQTEDQAAGPAAEDLAFARAIAAGDAAAMRRAVDEFLPPIYAVARRMLRNDAEAEEIAQETFLRVWKNAGNWTPKGARLSTWVHRIAINLCYDVLRKKGRKPTVDLDQAPDPVETRPGPSSGLEVQARNSALEEALDQLPERQRAAIVLVHLEEMSNKDAAEAMEVSVEALESLLSRGRRGLRAALAPKAGELLGELE